MVTIIHPPTIKFRWMFQRPQQMFNQFARLGYQVIYCNPAGKNEGKSIMNPSPRLYICTRTDPLTIPHGEPRVLWVDAPIFVKYIDRYKPHLVVYDALDSHTEEFASWAPYVDELRRRADLIFATSEKLFAENSLHHPRVILCPNGVDYHHFAPARQQSPVRPPDIPDNGRPVIGYCGALATWLDWDLIDYITEENKNFNFVFVGPLYNTRLPFQKPNMIVTGYREYRLLPNYLQCFDVCLIPFKITSMTEGCNPIKMYEYLSTGRPVVSTPLPEVIKHPEIYVGNDYIQFNRWIHHALGQDTEQNRRQRLELAQSNSWEQRAKTVMSAINEKLTERGWFVQ